MIDFSLRKKEVEIMIKEIKNNKLTLYQYDHCPYCIRVRMALSIKGFDYKCITLAYDDVKTPTRIYGKKVLPFILKPDETVMGESLDIINYLDNLDKKPIISKEGITDSIQTQLNGIRSSANQLVKPRIVATAINDFKTRGAVDYYENKCIKKIGLNFSQLLENTSNYLPVVQAGLDEIEALWPNEAKGAQNFHGRTFSMADLYLFPFLRNLTVVKELHFGTRVSSYLIYQSKNSGIDLF